LDFRKVKDGLRALLRRFGENQSGQIAILFALCATALVTAIGAGLDLSRAFVSRQELSNAATLTCQYSTRPPIVAIVYNGGNGQANYQATVNAYAQSFLASQNFQFTQTNATPFTYAPGGSSSVNLTASVPTIFMSIIGVNTLPISANVACNNGQVEPTETQSQSVFTESFESAACTGSCWGAFAPSGAINTFSATATNTFPSKLGYVGISNTQWAVMGYCLEIDSVGIILGSVPDGTHSAELDCDNGSGTKGNSSISNKSYFAAGTYELRYNYSGRVAYPNYSPTYICGSSATDVAWANDTTTASGTALRTNQINVYFDADNNGSPGLHTTIDGTQQLAGVNLIDECVYSPNWIQRSVKITVTTPGYYWTSFAADGANDSYGGQIDNIMMCRTSCSGSVTDNFPSAWTSGKKLFEDTFDSPAYSDVYYGAGFNSSGNLNTSYGTSGSSSGWPGQSSSGWATAPYNQVDILTKYSAQGNQSIELDSDLNSGQSTSNRSIARGFYLDPGYYSVTYNYISDAIFPGVNTTYCLYAPGGAFGFFGYTGMANANLRLGGTLSVANDTSSLAVFMSHSQLASTPNGGGGLNSTTSYTNPDGSVTTTPTVAPDALNIYSYNGSQVNPVLDFCQYASSWQTRTTYIKITKPGQYWLTFAAKGTADKVGAAIDDVRLASLNSLYGSAPSFYVTIPTPGPAPGSSVSYTGFSIVADPNTP
jgi:hypothetical protein